MCSCAGHKTKLQYDMTNGFCHFLQIVKDQSVVNLSDTVIYSNQLAQNIDPYRANSKKRNFFL